MDLLEYKATPTSQEGELRAELGRIKVEHKRLQKRIFELQNEIMQKEIVKIVTAFLKKYSNAKSVPPLDKLLMINVLTVGADRNYSRRIFFDDEYRIYIYLRDERSHGEWFLINERTIIE